MQLSYMVLIPTAFEVFEELEEFENNARPTVAFLEFRPVGNVRKNFRWSGVMAVRLY